MLTAKIRDGRIEADEPIPVMWEGLTVQLLPLSVEDIADDLQPPQAAGPADSALPESRRNEIERWIRSASTIAETLDEADGQTLQSAVTEIRRQARELARRAETSL